MAGLPPVLYAVLLELLLAKVHGLLLPERAGAAARVVRRAELWLHFTGPMWRAHRAGLRAQVPAPRPVPGETGGVAPGRADADDGAPRIAPVVAGSLGPAEASRTGMPTAGTSGASRPGAAHAGDAGVGAMCLPVTGAAPVPDPGAARLRRGAKRAAFEAGLVEQLRRGDMRLFSADRRVRNSAAYDAAAALPAPLSSGTARRYVLDVLPRLYAESTTGPAATAPSGAAHANHTAQTPSTADPIGADHAERTDSILER